LRAPVTGESIELAASKVSSNGAQATTLNTQASVVLAEPPAEAPPVNAAPVESKTSAVRIVWIFTKYWEPLLASARVRVVDIYILGLENNLAE
jgi:hypothetical protein